MSPACRPAPSKPGAEDGERRARPEGARPGAGTRQFLAGRRFTVADIALYAYAHVADEAGFDLNDYPAVLAWMERVSGQPGFLDMPALFQNVPTVNFDDAPAA